MIDAFGSKDLGDDFLLALRAAGVRVLKYRPEISPWTLRRERLRRLHRKIAVVDARIAFVGGINIIDDMHTPNQVPPRFDYAVRVEGPFGISYLRESHRGPVIAVAGGSGMAPVKSIVERALARGLPQHIYLYFGVRSARDLYLEDHFRELAGRHANLHFVAVVEDGDGLARRCGRVHEAVAADFDEFDGCKAYLAGPPAMVEAASKLFERRGMRRSDIHADAFYTAAEMAPAAKRKGATP